MTNKEAISVLLQARKILSGHGKASVLCEGIDKAVQALRDAEYYRWHYVDEGSGDRTEDIKDAIYGKKGWRRVLVMKISDKNEDAGAYFISEELEDMLEDCWAWIRENHFEEETFNCPVWYRPTGKVLANVIFKDGMAQIETV